MIYIYIQIIYTYKHRNTHTRIYGYIACVCVCFYVCMYIFNLSVSYGIFFFDCLSHLFGHTRLMSQDHMRQMLADKDWSWRGWQGKNINMSYSCFLDSTIMVYCLILTHNIWSYYIMLSGFKLRTIPHMSTCQLVLSFKFLQAGWSKISPSAQESCDVTLAVSSACPVTKSHVSDGPVSL